jgi:hypothetical protein
MYGGWDPSAQSGGSKSEQHCLHVQWTWSLLHWLHCTWSLLTRILTPIQGLLSSPLSPPLSLTRILTPIQGVGTGIGRLGGVEKELEHDEERDRT